MINFRHPPHLSKRYITPQGHRPCIRAASTLVHLLSMDFHQTGALNVPPLGSKQLGFVGPKSTSGFLLYGRILVLYYLKIPEPSAFPSTNFVAALRTVRVPNHSSSCLFLHHWRALFKLALLAKHKLGDPKRSGRASRRPGSKYIDRMQLQRPLRELKIVCMARDSTSLGDSPNRY